jgi:hypothetical protein
MSKLKRRAIVLSMLLVGVVFCVCVAISQKNTKLYTISQINRGHAPEGELSVIGYVAKIYELPDCPQDALCKRSMRPNIIISERPIKIKSYSKMTQREIIVFVPNYDTFKTLGKKYKFLLRIGNSKTTHGRTNDISLIDFQPIK